MGFLKLFERSGIILIAISICTIVISMRGRTKNVKGASPQSTILAQSLYILIPSYASRLETSTHVREAHAS